MDTTDDARCCVLLEKADCSELYHMLKGRGGSELKTKLLEAMERLDPYLYNLWKEHNE